MNYILQHKWCMICLTTESDTAKNDNGDPTNTGSIGSRAQQRILNAKWLIEVTPNS